MLEQYENGGWKKAIPLKCPSKLACIIDNLKDDVFEPIKKYFKNIKSKEEEIDREWLEKCEKLSYSSPDPSTKCGCIIVGIDGKEIGRGVNSLPTGVENNPEYLENRDIKYPLIVHAEMNALINCREHPGGSTVYVNFPCCSRCLGILNNYHVSRIVCYANDNPRWKDSWKICNIIKQTGRFEYKEYNK